MVESDRKKAAFLRAVIADIGLSAEVYHSRIEALGDALPTGLAAIDVITARALAPLGDLLGLLHPFYDSSTVALLHKGRHWQEELTASEQYWKLTYKAHISDTNADARLLKSRPGTAILLKAAGSGGLTSQESRLTAFSSPPRALCVWPIKKAVSARPPRR